MADANEALVKTQEQLSTGRRVLDPSDDPVASTKILAIEADLAGITQFQNNINIGKNNLVIEESILSGVNNVIQRIQELAVQAGNTATLSTAEYDSIANEVDSRIEELKNLLNTQNANGDFIFGGYKSKEPPFVGTADTGFEYIGDEGQQFIQVANNTTVPVSDSGKALFIDIQSAQNTITTSVSENNSSNPPIQVSVGENCRSGSLRRVLPTRHCHCVLTLIAIFLRPVKNFTAFERNTGRVLLADQPFQNGAEIVIEGASVRITGSPVSGVEATPATRDFGADIAATFPVDFFSCE